MKQNHVVLRPVVEILELLEVAKGEGVPLNAFGVLVNKNPERTLKTLVEYGNIAFQDGRYYIMKYLP